ncbi:MAG: MerR family transcriptional regulator [Thermomicrobiales bacterium]|nr:MerR family transcriptional regulator [Thermomicrobiales bacterium]
MSKGDMSISAFSRRSLLSVKALRLYDEMGLLRPDSVDPSSGYRFYREGQLERARLISLLRRSGMPLAEIREIVGLPSIEAAEALALWWVREEEEYAARKDLVQYIRGSMLGVEVLAESATPYQVQLRDVSPTTYLYVTRKLHGPELPVFIGSSESWLHERAEVYGGDRGRVTVVFQGVVDLDSDGPVDVCLPIAPGTQPLDDDLIRIEAAHTHAYVSLTRPQVAFPQILQVYHAIRKWIPANGYEISGPPREIYNGDLFAADSDQLVCDVAFPVRSTR